MNGYAMTVSVLCVILFFFCIMLAIILKRRMGAVAQAEEMLADILECSSDEKEREEQWNYWKKIYSEKQSEGVIGRLYARIWETAQILSSGKNKDQAEQMYLKDLMSDISHQMKTPLSSLQVFIDIFSEEFKKEGRFEELVHMAGQQIERMRWLVTGLLKLAQIESGAYEFELKEQSLTETIRKSVDALKIKLSQKHIKIKLLEDVIKEGDIRICHDTDWMQEAYTNLLKNAITYAPADSDIFIRIEETPIAVTVSVEDRGEGIPQGELPKIFNRFYRVHKTGQTEEGVGIGLALAKSIVEANGGIITVYSQQGEESYTRFVTTFLK